MINEKSIFTLTIPQWVSQVRVGTVKTEYYTKKDNLPEKYAGAKLRKAGNSEYYVDGRNKKIVKNPATKGTPELWNLNGQAFYSTNMHWKMRTVIVNFYHAYFMKYIKKEWKEQFPVFLSYKLNMKIKIFDIYSSKTPDITNMWILAKMFEDTVVKAGILRDDSPEFRMETTYGYNFVDNVEDRKLVITFYYEQY